MGSLSSRSRGLALALLHALARTRTCARARACGSAIGPARRRALDARGRSRALEGARGRSRALKRAARQRCSPPELVSLGAPPLRSGSRSCTRSRARSHAHARGSAVVLVRRRSRALEGTRGRSSARARERATAVLLTRASSDGGPTPTLGPPLALPHALARVRACGSAIVPARRRARALEGARGRSRALESARGRSRSARPGHATVQNTTTGGVNPGLLINYFRRKFSPNDGEIATQTPQNGDLCACGAGGLIHRQILFSALARYRSRELLRSRSRSWQ